MPVFAFLAGRLRDECAVRESAFRAAANGGFIEIDLAWNGPGPAPDALERWKPQAVQVGTEQTPLSIRHVLERHGGEVWHQTNPQPRDSWFRFLIPIAEPVAPVQRRRVPAASRPEYYDFDLFKNVGAAHGLAAQPLSALSYTVFDTETTGVEPSAGDKIV